MSFQVRVAKGSGVGKDEVKSLVDELLKLKADYKTLTGADAPQSAPAKQQNKQQQQGIVNTIQTVHRNPPLQIKSTSFYNKSNPYVV